MRQDGVNWEVKMLTWNQRAANRGLLLILSRTGELSTGVLILILPGLGKQSTGSLRLKLPGTGVH